MKKVLYDTYNRQDVHLYTIGDGNIEVDICDLGARINALRVNGTDVVLGFNSVQDYLDSGTYAGATIGRVANRIANGKFTLDGTEYTLNTNDGKNHLHGGFEGFDRKFFTVLSHTENALTMQYVSCDGEEHYPGNLEFTVLFTVKDKSLFIEYTAVCDKDTLWVPTNHAYFNLDGEGATDCRNNMLQINASYYTPVDDGLIPTGEKRAVKGTAFDFTNGKPIGKDFGSNELIATNGYDHNYVVDGEHIANVKSTQTGIEMDIYSDMPCVQLYTGGMIRGCSGKTHEYNTWAGFCLEPQYCPNAINMLDFDKPILRKSEKKIHYIKLAF